MTRKLAPNGSFDLASIGADNLNENIEQASQRGEGMGGDELMKLRFEHAWRYFQVHAQQRLTNFQFAVTTIAAVYALIAASKQYDLSVLVSSGCWAGLAACILFWLTDRRNRRLVKASETDLLAFEMKFQAADAGYAGPLQSSNAGAFFLFRYSALNLLFFLVNALVFGWLLYLENVALLESWWRAVAAPGA